MQSERHSLPLPSLTIAVIINSLIACTSNGPAESVAAGGQAATGGSSWVGTPGTGGSVKSGEPSSKASSGNTGGSDEATSGANSSVGGSAASKSSSASAHSGGGSSKDTARKSQGGGSSVSAGGSATGGSSVAGSSSIAQGGSGTCPIVKEFETWSGGSPTQVGKAAVEDFKPRTNETYGGDGYAWTFGYVGSLQFTRTIDDTVSNKELVDQFDCTQQGPDNGATASVDTRAFGVLPLEIYIQKGTEACLKLGLARADAQWAKTTEDGITSDARYWIDDMYMITSLQVYAYRASKEIQYLERATRAMLAYIPELQKGVDGLFWHTKQSQAHWGRANGWVAAGMTELLLELPHGKERTDILAAYTRQMDALLPLQITSGDDLGAWRQVLNRSEAKPEMSCTAMFTYALATGVKNGWLKDAKYVTAAVNGWKALAKKTNKGQLSQVCPGTGQAPAGGLASQEKFYMDIVFPPNDRHGQGPELWAATALLRDDCPGVR